MMEKQHIFFDYNSSMPMLVPVKKAIISAIDIVGNPSSVHYFGRNARKRIEQARQSISSFFKANRPDEIIFNSGATEGNNTIIKSFTQLNANIFISATEHKCIIESAPNAIQIPVHQNGIIDLAKLQFLLAQIDNDRPILISVMLANNETGVIQPLSAIIKLAKQYNAFVHSDIAQALGKITFDLQEYPVDYFTASGHKIGGPTGCGITYIKTKAPYHNLLDGGGQEKNKRSGTLNILGVIGMSVAIDYIDTHQWTKCRNLITSIEQEIKQFCSLAEIWGQDTLRLPNTSAIYMPQVSSTTQLMSFEIEGFAISTGSACSSGTVSSSHVLQAMNIESSKIQETIRISIAPSTTKLEAEKFIQAWQNVYNRANQDK